MKQIFAFLLALALLASFAACSSKDPSTASSASSATKGTESSTSTDEADPGDTETDGDEVGTTFAPNAEGYYEIYTAEDFIAFADTLNEYLISNVSMPQNAILMADIDLSAYYGEGNSMLPIGGPFSTESNGKTITVSGRFEGEFNGNGHTISGIYMDGNELGTQSAGIFNRIGGEAKIVDLKIADSTFIGSQYVGSLCSTSQGGVFKNCTIDKTVSVIGRNAADPSALAGSVGGLIGYADGDTGGIIIVYQCENDGTINGTRAGGFAGQATRDAYFLACENYGEISGEYGAGIVAAHQGSSYYDGLVLGCINYGSVSGNKCAAGILADSKTSILYCVNAGHVDGGETGDVYAVTDMADGLVNDCGNVGIISGANISAYSSTVLYPAYNWDFGTYEGLSQEGFSLPGYHADPGGAWAKGLNDRLERIQPLDSASLTDGTLVQILNEHGYWVQGKDFPVWDGEGGLDDYPTVVKRLDI